MDERLNSSNAVPRAGAPSKHVEPFAPRACPRSAFDDALLFYLMLQARDGRDGMRDGRRAAMIHALDNRATWIQIRHWRRGTGRVPQWARDLILDKIAKRLSRAEHVKAKLQNETIRATASDRY